MKKLVFWLITLLFPILILVLTEGAFRIFDYNSDAQDLFEEAPNNPAFLVSNPDFVKRYFPSFVPQIAPNAFLKSKRSNTFRVFVFGGSSTQGFPYNFYYSFAEQLEQRLLLNTEGVHVEVINLGMTAVNSYVIRDLSQRVLEFEPDAIIIYAGHNEYYGSFGAGSTQFGSTNSIQIKRLILWLKNMRFYQFLESLMSSDNADSGERRTMMAKVIKHSDIELDGEVFNRGIQQFQRNMGDVLSLFEDNNIPVYIGKVASNLKDQSPLTENEEAQQVFDQANGEFQEGNIEQATLDFISAKEQDGIRFRAPNRINEEIEQLASQYSANLFDVETLLREKSESGIEDASLFIDHLHPNHTGHQLIADLLIEELIQFPTLSANYQPNIFEVPSEISQFENAYANVSIARLLVGYPFKKGISIEQELADFEAIYQDYLSKSFIDSVGAVTAKNQIHVPLVLTDIVNVAQQKGDSLAAISHYTELMRWQLNSTSLIEKGIEYAVNNRSTDDYLANMLLQVLNDGNYDPRYIDVLSSLYLLRGNTENSEYWLKESERLNPNSARMLYNFGRFHLLNGDTLQSQNYYQRFLQVQSNR